MPTLRILTNASLPAEERTPFMARTSRALAEMLGKPESYVMLILEDQKDMLFGGTREPAAYLELKSLGLPEARTAEFSKTLCHLVTEGLGVPAARTYIEFAAPPPRLFGWNGGTF